MKPIKKVSMAYKHCFTESPNNKWYVTADGEVIRSSKISNFSKKLVPYWHHKSLIVHANKKSWVLNVLVIKSFYPQYRDYTFIVKHKDNDKSNCEISNLIPISRKRHGELTGWMSKSYPITVRKKGSTVTKTYRSIREAAKALYVSYQTILDYMNPEKKPKNSVLSKYIIQKSIE